VTAVLDGYLYEADRNGDEKQQHDPKHHRDKKGNRKNEWSAHVNQCFTFTN
jgi:plasmid maintenance system killer protein